MVAPRNMPDLSGYETPYLLLLVVGGQVGLPILVLTTFLSKRLHVHPALWNFWLTWILYSISYCILIYAGEARKLSPNTGVCLTQAAMVHGSPPVAVVSSLILVIYVWSTLHEPASSLLQRTRPWLRTVLVVAPPYVVYFAFALLYGVLGHMNPAKLSGAHGLYCTLNIEPLWLIPGFCLVIMVVILGFEAAIVWNIVSRWLSMRRSFPLAKRRTPLSIGFRVLVFSVYSGASAGMSLMLLANTSSIAPYMVQASLPLAAFIVFGTQHDIILVWFPFLRKPEEVPTGPLVSERKMSAGSARTFPYTPTSPVLEMDWREEHTRNAGHILDGPRPMSLDTVSEEDAADDDSDNDASSIKSNTPLTPREAVKRRTGADAV